MKLNLYLLLFIAGAVFSGCKQAPYFSKAIELNGVWSYSNALDYTFEIDQLESYYDLIFLLNYGLDYKYQNIYVKVTTTFPDQTSNEDILSLNLSNKMGIFLGDCNSSTCEIPILLKENFKFKEQGEYSISIEQHGRIENLQSINSAELQLYQLTKE